MQMTLPRLALALSRNAVASQPEQDGSAQNHAASPRRASTTSPRGQDALVCAALDKNAPSDKRFSILSLHAQLELLKLKTVIEVLLLHQRCCPFARVAGSKAL